MVNVEIVRRIGSTEMAADDNLVVSDLIVKGLAVFHRLRLG